VAKVKVATSRKRLNTKRESEQPDEVMTQLQRLSDHLSNHFWRYIVSIVVVMAGSLVIQWYVDSMEEKQAGATEAVGEVFQVLGSTLKTDVDESAPSADPENTAPVKADYETAQARAEAAVSKANALEEVGSGDLDALVRAGLGRAQMELKQWDDAASSFQAFSDAAKDSSVAALITENQGRVAQAAGKDDDAAQHYQRLSESADLYYKVRGHMLLGNLYNPNFAKSGSGNAAQSREHYAAALNALTPSEGQTLTVPLKALRGELTRRQALLP
jgi:tetratricopeptide (TPR) repeat protein